MNKIIFDSFKRRIDYLRISVTDRCNLKCIYCSPKERRKFFADSELLSSNEIIRIAGMAYKNGLSKVRLTGGEPLLRKDILQIISSIKNIGIRDLSMTTNGILLADMAEELKKAGLNRVNISLDTLNYEKYKKMTRGGNIRHVWNAIKKAEETGLTPVKINVVPIRGLNEDEIREFASLTFEKDYHIRFIELMPVGPNGRKAMRNSIKKDEIMKKISVLGELTLLEFKGKGPSRNYRIKGAKGIIGFISPLSDCFCEFCNRMRLTSNGKLRPCLFSDFEVDLKTPMRSGISGKELEELFQQAVASKPERHYLDDQMHTNTKSFFMSKIGG